jgi:ketosteroid isomerase-like protein
MKKLILLTLVFGSSAALADATEDVRCQEINFSKSLESLDLLLFMTFLDEEVRFVSEVVRRGPQEIATGWSIFTAEDGPRIKWRPQFVEVTEDGTLALTRGPYKLTVSDENGNLSEHWGTFNSVWRLKEDGSWKVIFDAGSPTVSPAEEVQALLDQEDNCAE